MWAKHLWETTLVLYKAALNDWNKGTGGGSGLDTEFETWDKNKFSKYNVDLPNYNHTNIAERPLILFHLYAKTKEPYLTVIRLWDKSVDNILCSKYDPIDIATPREKKRKAKVLEGGANLNAVLNSISNICDNMYNNDTKASGTAEEDKDKIGIKHMSLPELYEAVEQYKKQLWFLQEIHMLPNEENYRLVEKTKELFVEIDARTSNGVS